MNIDSREILTQPVHFIAFGFGAGLSPVAPGTMGTLIAIPIYWLLSGLPLLSYIIAVIAILLVGIYTSGESARRLGEHDYGGIVIDEIAGFLIAMIAIPVYWGWIVLGFLLFRFFDILKPWPISWLDKHVHGGLGIMADDVLAGIYALLSLHIVIWSVV